MSKREKVEVHEGARAGVVVSVRLSPDEAELLNRLAESEGSTMSATLRRALQALAGGSKDQAGDPSEFTRGGSSAESPVFTA